MKDSDWAQSRYWNCVSAQNSAIVGCHRVYVDASDVIVVGAADCVIERDSHGEIVVVGLHAGLVIDLRPDELDVIDAIEAALLNKFGP